MVSHRLPPSVAGANGLRDEIPAALGSFVDGSRVAWIALPQAGGDQPDPDSRRIAVKLNDADRDGFERFCEQALRPLFHDEPSRCNFAPESWNAYQRANLQYALAVAAHAQPNGLVWAHDYH